MANKDAHNCRHQSGGSWGRGAVYSTPVGYVIINFTKTSVWWPVWRRVNGLGINKVQLGRAIFVFGLVTTYGGSSFRYFAGHPSV